MTRWVVVGLLLGMLSISCALEPTVDETKSDLNKYVFKDCNIAQWLEIGRQGSFQSNETGRHRFYRCFLHLDFDELCDIPEEIRPDNPNHTSRYLHFIPGKHELSIYIDYLDTEDGWKPVQFVVSKDVTSIFR